jgi:hypothetical protein
MGPGLAKRYYAPHRIRDTMLAASRASRHIDATNFENEE